jgi:hypothetical protein
MTNKNILFDLSHFKPSSGYGLMNSSIGLIQREINKGNQVTLFLRDSMKDFFLTTLNEINSISIKDNSYLFYINRELLLIRNADKFSNYSCPIPRAPLGIFIYKIFFKITIKISIQDLQFLYKSSELQTPLLKLIVLNLWTRYSLFLADEVETYSRFVKKLLYVYLGYKSNRVNNARKLDFQFNNFPEIDIKSFANKELKIFLPIESRNYKCSWFLEKIEKKNFMNTIFIVPNYISKDDEDKMKRLSLEYNKVDIKTDTSFRETIGNCDFMISPSLFEGFGFLPREFGALGTPSAVLNMHAYRDLPSRIFLKLSMKEFLEIDEKLIRNFLTNLVIDELISFSKNIYE